MHANVLTGMTSRLVVTRMKDGLSSAHADAAITLLKSG